MIKGSDDSGSGRRVVVEIERATYERLFGHAVSFDDNPDSVLNRVLDAHERNGRGHAVPFVDTPAPVLNRTLDARGQDGRESAAPRGKRRAERRIDPRALPDLAHTKVLEAVIDGRRIKPSWNPALRALLGCAMKRVGGDFGRLQEACQGKVHMVESRRKDGGYHRVPGLDISAQGLRATEACDALVTMAQALGIAVDVGFMWRDKEEAAFPGERARLQIAGMVDG